MVHSFQALDPKHSIIKRLHYPWICHLGGDGTDQDLSIQYKDNDLHVAIQITGASPVSSVCHIILELSENLTIAPLQPFLYKKKGQVLIYKIFSRKIKRY